VAVHLAGAGLVVDRAHRRGLGERVAEAHLALHLLREQAHEVLAHALVDEDSLGGRAALAGA
jgi:hypothetical protein